MEEDEDDFYGEVGGVKQEQVPDGDDIEEKMDVSDEEEEEDSDDDVQFTLEKPEGAKSEPPPKQQKTHHTRTTSDSRPQKSSTPLKQEPTRDNHRASSTAPLPTTLKGTLTHNGKEGKDYPQHRTSKIDIDGTPIWPPNGKPITEVDIDADLAENSKPWRLPGTDITDFFNYGFDEYTWTAYCIRQQTMGNTISEQKQADAQMKALLGSGGGGPGGGMPGMPPGMPMPSPEQMEMMMQGGGFPPEFMQMMQQGGMPGMGGMGGQGGGFQGGGFGSGQNSASPHPQAGQGFQPPQGPSGGQGQQGGFGQGSMEGFSPQQIAIMQQEQQGQMGGGGGRGRGRSRRGGW